MTVYQCRGIATNMQTAMMDQMNRIRVELRFTLVRIPHSNVIMEDVSTLIG